jgi:hypothetical protein
MQKREVELAKTFTLAGLQPIRLKSMPEAHFKPFVLY